MKKDMFIELYELNANDKVEKRKDGRVELSYLSWSWAYAEFMKRYPDMQFEIVKFDGKPYLFDENLGYMVFTRVTVEDDTREMWLPVMNGANKAMKHEPYTYTTKYGEKSVEAATMFDINKTIMRCLVKNFALFGLGLYIYAGEDLPEISEDTKQEIKDKKDKLMKLGTAMNFVGVSKQEMQDRITELGKNIETERRFGVTESIKLTSEQIDELITWLENKVNTLPPIENPKDNPKDNPKEEIEFDFGNNE